MPASDPITVPRRPGGRRERARRARIALRPAADRARLPGRHPRRPPRARLLERVRGRLRRGLGGRHDAAALHALWLTILITAIAVPLNTIFGVAAALVLVRRRVPGRTVHQRPHRPAPRPLAGGRRPLDPARLGAQRLVRARHRRTRDPGGLRAARHGARDDLRLPALRGARGGAGAPRGRAPTRRRPRPRSAPARSRPSGASPSRRSAGGSSTASCSPPRAPSGSTARSRVVSGRHRGQDRDPDPPRGGALPGLRLRRGLRRRPWCSPSWRSSPSWQ